MTAEASATFPCFGSTCTVHVMGGGAEAAVAGARAQLLGWHAAFTRFEPTSELSRLNADPRADVPASPLMLRLAEAVAFAAEWTGGLVDATLLEPLELAGYTDDLPSSIPLAQALAAAPARRPASGRPASRAGSIGVDRARGIVQRPPGVLIDSGGLAKGLFADALAESLADHDSFAIECAGDLRVGGAAQLPRPVHVASPFDAEILHTFDLPDAGVATSGIGRRSWLGAGGKPAHHLLDPSTGRPAYTGVVQATAIAPTALEAEMRTKAAVLSGPSGGRAWLEHGGVLVFDDGSFEVVPPKTTVRAA